MIRYVLFPAILVYSLSAPAIALAKWSEWYDLTNPSEVRKLNEFFDEKKGYRVVPKYVKCKLDDDKLLIKIDYRSAWTGGIWYLRIGFWKNLKPEFDQAKRRGATIKSRSDVDTDKGLFTCIIWLKPR